ncbi:MAG: hypothetical protein KKH21_13545 [Gammaproteobacteria bacterium]|nr:hypothetical protein [Gammaproteobacteria bacterium]
MPTHSLARCLVHKVMDHRNFAVGSTLRCHPHRASLVEVVDCRRGRRIDPVSPDAPIAV